MKKLLVVAMVAFGAVMAQAGTFYWRVNYKTMDSNIASMWVQNGAIAMVFAASDIKSVKQLFGKTQTGSTLKNALRSESLANAEFSVSGSYVTTGTEEMPNAAPVPADGKVVVAIFGDHDFSDATDVYWTSVTTVIEGETYTLDNDSFGDPEMIVQIKEAYPPETAPEPGMLALLALGVAGLALKRKVA